jgi:hypothetical protein
MRKWFVWVFLAFLAGLPAASAEQRGIGFKTIDWAIHPDVQGKERAILRAALEVVFEECPALGQVDWEAVAKKQGQYAAGVSFSPSKIDTAQAGDVVAPFIEGWTRHGFAYLSIHQSEIHWSLDFSWEEPPGIATRMETGAGFEHYPLDNWEKKVAITTS